MSGSGENQKKQRNLKLPLQKRQEKRFKSGENTLFHQSLREEGGGEAAEMTDILSHVHAITKGDPTIEMSPPHPPSEETPAYAKAHHHLVYELDSPCAMCGVRQSTLNDPKENPFGAAAIETHHYPIPRHLLDACDPRKVGIVFPQVTDRASLETFIDSEHNLMVLCDIHHRHPLHGIHHLPAADFFIQVFLLGGYEVIVGAADESAMAVDEALIEGIEKKESYSQIPHTTDEPVSFDFDSESVMAPSDMVAACEAYPSTMPPDYFANEGYNESVFYQSLREADGERVKSSVPSDVHASEASRQKDVLSSESQVRHLHARLPDRVRVGDRIALEVRVALSAALDKSKALRNFTVSPRGAEVKLTLHCPGFLVHSANVAKVHVLPTADSDWALFEIEALHEGAYTLEVSAYNEGAFLGTLFLQLTVDDLARKGQQIDLVTSLPLRAPRDGEATLSIHYDPLSAVYRYQLLSRTVATDDLYSGPLRRKQEKVVADIIQLLNEKARGQTEYSAKETRRWLRGKGTELWSELIPQELEKRFWQERDHIKWLRILSDGDPMPWEMMYPTNDAEEDAGFLVEQFPIVRWMYGELPPEQLHYSEPRFVISDDAPLSAEKEIEALGRVMRGGQKVNDLSPLLELLDIANFDILHFACHNIFHSDSPTSSSILLGTKSFEPTFLNTYRGKHFRSRSPLVFMNACRSDGMAANYTWLAGWAKSFLNAGVGAFIGSLWEVRDSSASCFAEKFYHAALRGASLGEAMKQARIAIQDESGDPTWLAYTLYGDPDAVFSKNGESPSLK